MKTLTLIITALALLLAPQLLATNAREGNEVSDFPDSAGGVTAGFTYTLTTGANIFSGTLVALPRDVGDFFKITVAPGTVVTQITSNGASGISMPTAPLYAGTYLVSCSGQFLDNIEWSITFTVATAPDYDITTTGGQVILYDRSGLNDTLTLTEPFGGTIQFAAPGRTFSVDGGPFVTGNSGSFIPLNDISNPTVSVIVNAGAGNGTINVGDFSRTAAFPNLTINGGAGDDTVNFSGQITLSTNKSLSVNGGSAGADSANFITGANVVASGIGAITVICSQSISFSGGAVVQTQDGNISVQANQQSPAAVGNFIGVNLDGLGTALVSTNNGAVTVKGRGGNDPGGFQLGVQVINGATISGNFGVVDVNGMGGDNTGLVNRGVTVYGAGSAIRVNYGFMSVTGTGGPNGGYYGIGVSVLAGGAIVGPDTQGGQFFVTGTGAGAGGFNQGIELCGSGSMITSQGDSLVITGTAGVGSDSAGVYLANSSVISTPAAAGGGVNVYTDSLAIDNTASINTTNTSSYVAIFPLTSGLPIDLGGASPAGKLSLTDAVLDRITTGLLELDANADVITSANVSPANIGMLTLFGSSISPAAAGTDVTLGANRTLSLLSTLTIPITGPAADTGYPQLAVVGQVSLDPRITTLSLAGTTLAGTVGQTFTIVNNDGSDPIIGTFEDLPEGATLAWPGGPAGFVARISYVGGDGNDVVLTLVNSLLEVSNTNDSGTGSLRGALAYAASNPGADTITFAPAVNGVTIQLLSEIAINDPAGVAIDASALPSGITIKGLADQGGGGNFRLFSNASGSTLIINGMTLAYGGGSGFSFAGGAISNDGTLSLDRCTLFGNIAGSGGAIRNSALLALTRCTLTQNSSTSAGGTSAAINSDAPFGTESLALLHCTISGNNAPSGGAAIIAYGTFQLNHSIVAGNIPSEFGGSASPSGAHNITGTDPLLAPLGDYGGPTQTMALLPGSPARNAAVGSSVTSDQRGYPIVGTPDIGAYEAGTLGPNFNAYIWESLSTTNAADHAQNADFDADGATNYHEWLALTDPADPSSIFRNLQPSISGNILSFTFPSMVGRNYHLEASPDVLAWSTISDSTRAGTGSLITMRVVLLSGFQRYFFRTAVTP